MATRRRFAVILLSAGLVLGLESGGFAAPQVASQVTGDGEWHRLATVGTGPSERSAPAVAGVGSHVYVFGGVHDDLPSGVNTFFDDLYRLDTRSGRWQAMVPRNAPPPARAFAASTPHQPSERMFLFGGATFSGDGADFRAFGDLWSFDTRRRGWQQLAPANAGPGARSSPAMWTVGDVLYVFGGIDATFTTRNDLWAYHLNSNRWELVTVDGDPSAPPPRHVPQAGQRALGGVLTLYGGEGFDFAAGFSMFTDTWQYDLATGQWRELTPAVDIDPPRNYGATAVIGDSLYLQGGDTPGGNPGCGAPFPNNVVDELWRLDAATGAWRRLAPAGEPMPSLKRHAAAVVGRSMYVVSGWDFVCEAGLGPGQVWNLDTYVFTP